MSLDERDEELVRLTSDVVVAYVSNNSVPQASLPGLIAEVHASLSKLDVRAAEAVVETQKPAISIKKSVTDEYIICLEDGKKFKSLRRHLSLLGMTPEGYRAKWNLPADYPMVAPAYAAARSELAKKFGLGRKPAEKPKPAKRARKAA